MDLLQVVMLALSISLSLTVFGFGLRATVGDALYLVRRPGLLARSLLAMFVVLPMAMVVIARTFDVERRVEIALIALALSPVPPALPRRADHLGPHSGYPVGLMATMSLLSIVVVQIAFVVLGRLSGRQFSMPAMAMAATILQSVLVPLLLGMLVRHWRPHFAERFDKPLAIGAGGLLAAAVMALVGANLSTLWAVASPGAVFAIVAFVLIGLLAGHSLGGPDPEHARVLALATGSRHPGIALAIASANYPLERFGGVILLYLVVSLIVAIPYVRSQRSKTAHAVA